MDATISVPRGAALRRDKVAYWATTGLIALVMFSSGLNFAFNPSAKAAVSHLGVPPWFLAELTVAKLVGAIALVLPVTPPLPREFAYFGFALTIVSADIAHLSSGDTPLYMVPHLFFLGCLVVSRRLYRKLHPSEA